MRAWLWFLVVVLQLAAGQAVAQEEVARDHFKRGEAAYEKGAYANAIAEWQAAYTADPRPRFQYNIYQAQERLGQLAEALESLQRYLSSADPDDPVYSDATARLAALEQRLKATGIRLVGGPPGGSINVSGQDWGRLPRPDRIPVQPGNHRVVVQLTGYQDFIANVIVPAGQVVDVPVQLEALPSDPSAASKARTSAAADSTDKSDPLPFFIVSAGLGAGAIGTLVWTLNRNSELAGCADPAFYCPEQDTVKTQRNLGIGATALLGAGAVATLIYGLLLSNDAHESAALCVPSVAGASCRLSF